MPSAFDLCALSWADREGYVSIATRDPTKKKDEEGYWHNYMFAWPKEAERIKGALAKASSSPLDVYFAPAVFSTKRRKRTAVEPTNMLWADLDEVDPYKLPDSLKPTAAWQTSPGRWQALWKLDMNLDAQEQTELNQRLSYAINADKGGWDLTQVLRIPGTHNHKYPNSPTVRLEWLNGHQLRTNKLLLDLPDLSSPKPSTHETEELPDPKVVVRQYRMNARARELILARHAQTGIRSDRLWELACLLAEAGAKPNEIVAVTRSTVWNKFKGRGDELTRLFAEADKAIAHTGPSTERSESTESIMTDDVIEEAEPRGPIAWDDFDRDHQAATWLIADVWGDSEVGFISGLPKSYKSWIALDFAVSVATGTRFLGTFQAHKHNVLLIQEEDPKFVLQDRLLKIAANKGLVSVNTDGESDTFQMRYALPDNLYIISNQGFTINEDWLDELEDWIKERDIRLLILDPLMMMGEGFDEFKAFEMMQSILKPLKRLRSRTHAAIVVVHHHFKGSATGGARDMYGSVALWAWEEAALHLSIAGVGQLTAERFSKHSLLSPINVEIGDVEEIWHPNIVKSHGANSLLDQLATMPGGATVEELEQSTGVGRDALLRQLKSLEGNGKVKKAGSRGTDRPGRRKVVWSLA